MEEDNGAILLYRFNIIADRPYASLYLQVVVYYARGGRDTVGTVATYFFTDSLSNSATIMERRAQTIAGTRFMLARNEGD